jgi:glutathione S-transferase
MRPHWALHEVGVTYEKNLVGPRSSVVQSPDFRSFNPKGKVPVLQDGDLTLTESAAIVNYIGDTYGVGSGLTPAVGTRDRALYDEWCFWTMMELDAHTLYVVRKHRDLADRYGAAPSAVAEAFAGFDRQVTVANGALEDDRPWLLGETFSGADILLVTCLDWAHFYDRELSPVLERYRARAAERPAYRAAAALNYSILPDGSPRPTPS